jgi:uncharacterized RDD family membrane protein YckC
MRCPKCHYLSFDPEPRCRNCGYGLSLEDDDLLLRDRDEEVLPASPFADVNLRAAGVEPPPLRPPLPVVATAAAAVRAPSSFATAGNPPQPAVLDELTPAGRTMADAPSALPRSRPAATTELPLFVKGMSTGATAPVRMVNEPLVPLPEEPRPPLGVRRTIPESQVAKPRAMTARERKGPLDRDLLAGLQTDVARPREERAAQEATLSAGPAGAGRRLVAAALDGALLGSLSVAVMWLTLRWCGLPIDRALMLPVLVPTSVFVSMLGVGYLVLFNAAGGQTLGKMAVGLRVVREVTPFDAGGPVSFGQATLRALLTLPSVLVAGAGFLPALIGEERAVHDRLAHTRVVRA